MTIDAARSWLAEDPDPQTRAELAALIEKAEAGDAAAGADLADRFQGPLEFGTAGLRGALGAGLHRMNRVVVQRAAAGLVNWLVAEGTAPGTPVVIGYDARHNSDVFARDTAEIVAGAGLRPLLMPRALPTPVLAWAIRRHGCAAGVMVTASHNPPQDNGYKVYLGTGSQIVPPADIGIAAQIAAIGALADIRRAEVADDCVLGDDVVDDYVATVARLAPPTPAADLRIVSTPLHGVGGAVLADVLARAGFHDVAVVTEQEQPDADFPTVAFPNPEEPGAMDLALALARDREADLVIANDPDADRCACAVPDAGSPGGWRVLRGDEVGVLLADHLLRQGVAGTYAASIVSSSLIHKLAAAHGQPSEETLTGFKWISRVPGLVYGYEEALGYCVDPAEVADKDGISAALVLCEVAAGAKAAGHTLQDLLDDIAREHGLHATDQLSVRVEDLAEIGRAMARLRATAPTSLAGSAVTSAEDLAEGTEQLPPTDGLRYRMADGSRVIVRPSGTEPKLKCYLEAVVPVPDGDVAAARTEATAKLSALRADVAAAAGI